MKTFKNTQERIEAMTVIAAHYGRDKSADDLSEELNIPKGRISAYAAQMRGVGIDVARMKRFGSMIFLLRHLQKTKPGLLTKEALKLLNQ